MKKINAILTILCSAALLVGCNTPSSSSSNSSSSSSASNSSTSSSQVVAGFEVPASIDLVVGGVQQIVPTNITGLVASDFAYTSYDPAIASVSADGTITAIKEGSTTILVKAKELRKFVEVNVTDPYKLNNVSYRKYQNIAAISADNASIDYTGAPIFNYAWDGGTYDSTNTKVDFEDSREDSEAIVRTSASENANVSNGDYVVVLTTGDIATLTADTVKDGATASVYAKVEVSEYANAFRVWAWGNKSDVEQSLASGMGKFRVMAYEFNADYSEYTSTILKVSDSGTLVQDSQGWLSFDDISDTSNGQIAGAPADNMFIYEVNNTSYDLRNKTIILAFEAAEVANTLGAGGTNLPSRLGIKRMGFMCDPKPDFSISERTASLYSNETYQISPVSIGSAADGVYSYNSSNTAVAAVSESGLVTAQVVTETQVATITITNSNCGNKVVGLEVTVNPIPSTSFDVEATISMNVGQTYTITPTNQVSCDGFSFASSEKGLATVDQNGVITALNVGSVEITTTSGDLKKKTTVNITGTSSIMNISNQQISNTAGFENSSGFIGNWDFAWSGGVTADKIDADDSNLTSPLIHMSRVDSAGTQNNIHPNDIELISGIGGVRTDEVQNGVYVKSAISANATSFRLWGRSSAANADMIGRAKTRIVVYLPNADYTSYQAYILPLAAAEGYEAETVLQDRTTGIVSIASEAPSGFMVFSIPEEIKGATNAIIMIESYSVENEENKQTRLYVRRFGFDA